MRSLTHFRKSEIVYCKIAAVVELNSDKGEEGEMRPTLAGEEPEPGEESKAEKVNRE